MLQSSPVWARSTQVAVVPFAYDRWWTRRSGCDLLSTFDPIDERQRMDWCPSRRTEEPTVRRKARPAQRSGRGPEYSEATPAGRSGWRRREAASRPSGGIPDVAGRGGKRLDNIGLRPCELWTKIFPAPRVIGPVWSRVVSVVVFG